MTLATAHFGIGWWVIAAVFIATGVALCLACQALDLGPFWRWAHELREAVEDPGGELEGDRDGWGGDAV